ncbi:MAG: hypothetical protein NT127_01055 [Sphingobacteriales bacterium]|nr:hypothetical protein [Sphingobacteriales bacterium]
MKFTLLLFCFLGTLICNGQAKSSKINYDTITINPNEKGYIKNGLMEGKWKGVDGGWRRTFIEAANIEWVNLFEKGYLKEQVVYSKGKAIIKIFSKNDSIAIFSRFYENGIIAQSYPFLYKKQKNEDIWNDYEKNSNGLTDSLKKYYENGKLAYIMIFNKKHTDEHELMVFYKSGKLQSSGHYKRDKKVGKWTEFYENGKVKKITDHSSDSN